MNNMVIFIVLVVVGIGGVVYFSNQTTNPSITPAGLSALSTTPVVTSAETNTNPTPLPQAITLNPTVAAMPEISATTTALVKTTKGDITLTLYYKEAPNTVKNFIHKAQTGFYNNLSFHRVEDWVVQGGDPKGNGTGGDGMPTELNEKPFVVGSLGIARGGDIKVSNDAQFFITKQEASWLDKQYTNFGMVTAGMDVVTNMVIGDKILSITIK